MATLPSGEPLPRLAPPVAMGPSAAKRALACFETAYWARIVALLQASLRSVLNAMGTPEVHDNASLSDIRQETLLEALRAALRSVQPPLSAALPSHAGLPIPTARRGNLAAAQTTIGLYGAFTLKAAWAELAGLQESMLLAAGHDRMSRSTLHVSGVRQRLQLYVIELQRLPGALQAWAEACMDDEGVDDGATRKIVLEPLLEITLIVRRGCAAATQIARP